MSATENGERAGNACKTAQKPHPKSHKMSPFEISTDNSQFRACCADLPLYKTTDYYAPSHECSLLWNDQTVAIEWPADFQPRLAAKDAAGKLWPEADKFD